VDTHKPPCFAKVTIQNIRENLSAGGDMVQARKLLMVVENVSAPEDRRVWPEALALRDCGYQVSIISPKGHPGSQESYICLEGIHIYRYHVPIIEHRYTAYLVEYSVAFLMTFLLSIKVWFRHGFDAIHDAALYATPNLVEDYALKIEILLDDKKLRLRMGAFGRKRVEEALSWHETQKNLLLAYEALFR
jgi:Glycosyl transferase 4-like